MIMMNDDRDDDDDDDDDDDADDDDDFDGKRMTSAVPPRCFFCSAARGRPKAARAPRELANLVTRFSFLAFSGDPG